MAFDAALCRWGLMFMPTSGVMDGVRMALTSGGGSARSGLRPEGSNGERGLG